ncbi:MAG TPA: sigma-70 family RNA polymerase sigma factor [Gaiellales bacterium]|nr:sigma-70 family RNA polymerase sigma factor [Gaiellales bacterium]
MKPAPEPALAVREPLDADSRSWVDELGLPPGERDPAVARLHAYLVRVARFELRRRRSALPAASRRELDDLAVQAADDALFAVLRKLPTYRGASRFTTWAAKFAILEAAVKARRRAWHDRELTLEPEAWERFSAAGSAGRDIEQRERLEAIRDGIRTALTPHQREILVAAALNEFPIDVLAERLGTTRGAIYKTLHDARRNLRAHLAKMEAE